MIKIILLILVLGFSIANSQNVFMPRTVFNVETSCQTVQMKAYNFINNQLGHTIWKNYQLISTNTVVMGSSTTYFYRGDIRFPESKLSRTKSLIGAVTTYLDLKDQFVDRCYILYEKCRNHLRRRCKTKVVIYQK